MRSRPGSDLSGNSRRPWRRRAHGCRGGAPARRKISGTQPGTTLPWPSSRVLSGRLYEIGPTDTLTFGAVVLFLVAVACISTWIPARRATRIDPMVSLRSE